MGSFRILFMLVAMATPLVMPLSGHTEILTYDFVNLEGSDYFRGTFSYDTSGDPHRQLAPFSFTEGQIYLAPNSGVVRIHFTSGSFGFVSIKSGDLLANGNLTLYFSNTTTNLAQPLPLPILSESNYQWWNGSGSLFSLILHSLPQGNEQMFLQGNEQIQSQDLTRRDQIFTLVLFGMVVLGVLGYGWRHRQEIETEIRLLTNEIKPVMELLMVSWSRTPPPVGIETNVTYEEELETLLTM
jgi:hypothetical protein